MRMRSFSEIARFTRSTAAFIPNISYGEWSWSSEGFRNLFADSGSAIPRCRSSLAIAGGMFADCESCKEPAESLGFNCQRLPDFIGTYSGLYCRRCARASRRNTEPKVGIPLGFAMDGKMKGAEEQTTGASAPFVGSFHGCRDGLRQAVAAAPVFR